MRNVIPGILLFLLILSSALNCTGAEVVVPANQEEQTKVENLEPNSVYGFVPHPDTHWTANKYTEPKNFTDFRGSDGRNKTKYYGERNIGRLMMEVVTFLNAEKNKSSKDVYEFDGQALHKSIRTGPFGAVVWFEFADKEGTYGDNEGSCIVRYEKDDGKGSSLRPILPTTRSQEFARWRIDLNGAIHGEIDYEVGAGAEKKYDSVLVISFEDQTAEVREITKTFGRDPFKRRHGTHQEDVAPLSPSQIEKIRSIYLVTDLNRGPQSAIEYARVIVEGLEAWNDLYVRVMKTELAQHSAILLTGNGAGGIEGDRR